MAQLAANSTDPLERQRMAERLQRVAEEACRESFSELFEFYAPRLKSYLSRMGAEDGDAEELAQEVMVTVWRKAAQYDPAKASVSTWIFRIARNRSIDAHRRRTKPELDPEEPMLQPPEIQQPDTALGQRQTDEIVRKALDELPEEQIELLRAAFYDGLSHSEIAEKHSLPLGTVKSRIRLAFNRMRKRLQGEH